MSLMPSTNHVSAPLRLRERALFGLLPLQWENPVDLSELRIDRLQLRIFGQIRLGSAEQFEPWLGRIFGRAGTLGPDFLTGERHHGGAVYGTFRRDNVTISGQFSLYRAGRDAPPNERRVSLDLTLNPSRTLAHIEHSGRESHLRWLENDAFNFFRRTPLAAAQLKARTLDGNDNYIPSFFPRLPRHERRSRWLAYEADYHRQLIELLERAFIPDDCDEFPGLEGRLQWENASISLAEVYWERHDANALAQAWAIGERLMASARDARANVYADQAIGRRGREGQALCTYIPLTGEAEFKVYAKTEHRVRFELAYKGSLPAPVREQTRAWLQDGSSPGFLMSSMTALKADALSRAGRIWQSLGEQFRPAPPIPYETLIGQLVEAIIRASKDYPDVRPARVLEVLLRDAGVSLLPALSDFPRPFVNALVRAGVLHRLPYGLCQRQLGRPRYTLATPFLALSSLFPREMRFAAA